VAFAGLALGMFLPAANATMVATALPDIVGDVGGFESLPWVMTSYLVASAVALPLLGKLSDLFGRRPLFQLSLLLFAAGSLLAGLSGTIGHLVGARALQGFGGGGAMVLAQTAVADLVPPRQRGRYLGLIVAVLGIASVAGPLLGGLIVDRWSWRVAFHANVPLGLLAMAVASRFLPAAPKRTRPRVDVAGHVLLTVGLTALVLAVTVVAGPGGTRSPLVPLGAIVAVASAIALVGVERRAAEPVVVPELFGVRVFTVTLALGFLTSAVMFSVLVFVPLFAQGVAGLSSSEAGALLVPLIGSWVITTTVVGRLASRWNRYRPFPIAGSALIAVGYGLLAGVDAATSTNVLVGYLCVLGAGFGLTLQVLVVAVQNAVPPRHLGAATSAVQLVRTIGNSVGVTGAAALVNWRLSEGLGRASGLDGGRLIGDLAAVDALGAPARAVFQTALADALGFAFLAAVPIALAGLVLSLLLPEVGHLDVEPGVEPKAALAIT
jgi:EmrB/QacA subfamily drug resistance transporter